MRMDYNTQTGVSIEVEDVIDSHVLIELSPEQKEQQYKDLIISFIREKYSIDDEIALLRKDRADTLDDSEFVVYNTFAEDCKTRASEQLNYHN